MKQFYSFKSIIFTLGLFLAGFVAIAQNAIAGAGFTNGWPSACNQNTNFVYFSASAGTTWTSGALTPKGTGNQFWRMAVDWSGTIKQLNNGSATDVAVTPGTKYTLNGTCTASGAFFRNVSSLSNRYVFKTKDAGTAPSGNWVFFELAAAPISISSVSQSPIASSVSSGQSTTITASLSGSLPAGQGVYLRYTNNNYSTSTIVELSGAGTSYTATIPASFNTPNANVNYYLFTSGSGLSIPGADADLYTINLNNNGGTNYSYTVIPAPTISLGTNPTVCKGITAASLLYTGTTNSPNQYSLTFDGTALGQGFVSLTNAALSSSPIVITVPASAAPGTYTATLTVRNSTTGGVSASSPITITVAALPNAGTLSGTLSFCLNGTSTLTSNGNAGGNWSTSNSSIATVNSSGVVSGVGAGVATITYTVTNGSGCTASASSNVTITNNTSSSQTVSACDAYTWSENGQTYTTSGTYTYVAGCNTKTLNLTITPSTNTTTTASACSSYLWSVNGQTYTSSGTYTSVSGCATQILNLTITPTTSTTTTATACDSYTWSVNNQVYTSSGTYSVVTGCHTEILNLTIYLSTPSSQTITACDSYYWSVNGTTYTTSGTYVFEGVNAAGCPQNQTLYLTINTSSSSSQTETACDSYIWAVNGQTYTASGTYTYVSTNPAGCADTKTLNLTVNQSTSSSQTVSVCDSYSWEISGQTYTQSGTYTYTSTNASGCTDIKTLNLTITPSTTNTTTASACGSYLWAVNGQTYSESGTYSYTTGCHTEVLNLTVTPSTSNATTASSCDAYTWSINGQTYTASGTYTFITNCHTETLLLTINSSSSTTQTVTACNAYTWSVNGQTYTASGTYTVVGTTAAGCTDTKTLVLTINTSTSSSQTVSACGSYTWSVNGQTYTTSGTYTNIGINAAGCTDTKTLNLTISGINRSNASATWINGQNDNTTGFGAWSFSTVGTTAGFFSGSSDVNNGGTTSWGLFAAGGTNVASAVRPVSMGVGNTLSFSMDNGFIDTGKTIGFGLQNSAGENLAELLFIGGQSFYKMIDASTGDSSIGYTGSGLDVSLTYTGVNTYSITVAARGGATATYTGRTFKSQVGGQVPARIRFFNAGAGIGSSYDLFFNSLRISNPVLTTQPATAQQTICVGAMPTNLAVAASGAGQTYQWYASSSNGYSGTSLGSSNGGNTAILTPQNTTPGTTYYYCIVTDPCGSTYSTISGAVVVSAPPTPGTLSGPDAICVNGIAAFSTNGTSGGTWTSSSASIATVNSVGTVVGVSPGSATISYTLNGTGGCSSAAATKSIVVNALPTAGITNTTGTTVLTCTVTSIAVTATGGENYSWSNGSTVVGTAADLLINAAGTYTVAVTNGAGCSSTASIVISENKTTTSSETATACDTYTWALNGQTYTTSGNYTFVSTNEAGCVNTATLSLTINNSTASSQSISVCDSYTWPVNGQTYTVSGTYTYVGVTESGCTDTKTLNLTITPSTSNTTTATACDSYTWSVNNQAYTESGTYTVASGCHTEVLLLTITPSTSTTTTATACDLYTWSVNNQEYTASGTYTVVSGCHTEVLDLTITPSTSNSTTAAACDSYTWSVNNQEYTASGTYTVVSGCHTEVLDLTITPSTSNTTNATACDSYTWSMNNQEYTASGTYTAVAGCHTEVLNLTITPSSSHTTSAAACDTYTWAVNNQTYTTSGTYTVVNGCHTELLDLTITPSTSNVTTAAACDSYTWSVNNQAYTASGTYTVVSGCHTEVLNLTITTSSTNSTTATSCGDYLWSVNGQTYTATGVYTFVSNCHTEILNLTVSPCSTVLTLTLNIEGYYDVATHTMRPVLANQGVGTSMTDVDTVTVELHDATSFDTIETTSAMLQTDGTAVATFTYRTGSYYLVVKHRNSLETWSANPVSLGATASYNFAESAAKAYGNNMKELEPGVYGIYTGDNNQDGFIEASDYAPLFNDNDAAAEGYLTTDLNGDGFVEAGDYPILFNNSDAAIELVRP